MNIVLTKLTAFHEAQKTEKTEVKLRKSVYQASLLL